MKGIHKVVVGAKYLKYEFELRRNLTIIRGDSATGKTTLVDMKKVPMIEVMQLQIALMGQTIWKISFRRILD